MSPFITRGVSLFSARNSPLIQVTYPPSPPCTPLLLSPLPPLSAGAPCAPPPPPAPQYSLAGMVVVYLHGFASSPQSLKATFFAERFAEKGILFFCPDFNRPAFSTLTVSRMLQQLGEHISTLPPTEVVLIGSSLGGFVAVEASARQAFFAAAPDLAPHPAGACRRARMASLVRDWPGWRRALEADRLRRGLSLWAGTARTAGFRLL